MIGITSYGGYIPRLRLKRSTIVGAMGWLNPAIALLSSGERSVCNWDEDAVTMAVAAARNCLAGWNKKEIDSLYLASTTLPFIDRQNAGIIGTALNLRKDIIASDVTGSQKSGTTALISALSQVGSGAAKQVLITASDRRETRAGSFYELWFGDGAAAFTVGSEKVIAEFIGFHSESHDFVDHYRAAGKTFDYTWEERWVRDNGYSVIIPETIEALLSKVTLRKDQVKQFIFPCYFSKEHGKIAKKLNLSSDQVHDNLHEICGETGVAHPLLMTALFLENAKPDDIFVVAGFGQGCDALCFRVTENISNTLPRNRCSKTIEHGKPLDNYLKWLKWRDLLETQKDVRTEQPTVTALTTLWRNRDMLTGLVGGKCTRCKTPQFPKADVCVNPECGYRGSQESYPFQDIPARLKTFTGDMLAVSDDPPAIYGMVQFKGGGRFMADITDSSLEDLRVGMPVNMVFRKRITDRERGFTNYFWKAVPIPGFKDSIRFDGRVAVITGAGGGLGRIYAKELAARGARVVVNDYGGSRDGSGKGGSSAADRVVEEILAEGGEAVADYHNVASEKEAAQLIETALKAFGTIDILINNAGILRDKSLVKMEPDQWRSVIDVHLNGAFNVTQPAFKIMKEKGYGRIVMTTSGAGLYGNFGQTNYAAAKMGLVGLMNSLEIEGKKYGILVNAVAPLAASRLTKDIMPPDIFEKARPSLVAPMVLFLCSEKCGESGLVFNAGCGSFSRAAVLSGPGLDLKGTGTIPTPELLLENWKRIDSLEPAKEFHDANEAVLFFMNPVIEGGKDGLEPVKEKDTILDPKSVFDRMPDFFLPDAAMGLDIVFQYRLTGKNGGDWHCVIKNETCRVVPGIHESPACTLKMTDEDFVAMISGKLPSMTAFTSGKLVIEGDIMKSRLIEKVFRFPGIG